MENNEQAEVSLLTDKQWSVIEGELCRVTDFNPMSSEKLRGTPYASVKLECSKHQENKNLTGLITHKTDYQHLCMAIKKIEGSHDKEILIVWSRNNYKPFAKFFLKAFLPRLWVMVCKKGAFELLTDPNYKPELSGEVRWNAEKPIFEWKPDVMS